MKLVKALKITLVVLLCVGILVSTVIALYVSKSTGEPNKYFSDEEIKSLSAKIDTTEKGTIIMSGGAFDKDNSRRVLIETAIKKSGVEHPKVVFLPTGHLDVLADSEPIMDAFVAAGCETISILVSKVSAQEAQAAINQADIVYETGGNLPFIVNNWKEKGVWEALYRAYDRGAVLMGVSAGAMCWAKMGYDSCGEPKVRIVTDFPFIGKENAYEFVDAMNFVPFCICPHFDNMSWRLYALEAKKLSTPSIALENGVALIYHGGNYEILVDPNLPNRKAYMFYPEKNMYMADITNSPSLATVMHAYLAQQA